MRLVYVDEAGISNAKEEPFVTVAGVIVDADNELIRLEAHLERIVERHIPSHQREDFVFHAMHLFNGAGKGQVFDRDDPYWTLERRLKIADELAAIPKVFDLRVAFGWQERAKFGQAFDASNLTIRDRTMGCLAVSFLGCASIVDMWMRQNAIREVCMMIVEDNPDARSLIREVQTHNQDVRILRSLDEKAKKFFPFQRIKEEPAFQRKRPSHPLQLADFFAYVWKRYVMNQKDQRWLRYIDPIRGYIATYEE